ncbi:CBS domain-containing protein [Kitasatospora sp. NPDC001664]|uniref:CBS domain-containing protein n=2 Tax=Kitasatospora albolonga TaxID=68173 RepID=UPI0035EC9AEC
MTTQTARDIQSALTLSTPSVLGVRSVPGTGPTRPHEVTRRPTVGDAMVPWEYQITTDSTVERAEDVLRAAHVDYLVVRDHDGRCHGLVTRSGLHAFHASSWYTLRTRVREVGHQRGPFTWPAMDLVLAVLAMRIKHLTVWPVVDDDGYLVGVLTSTAATRHLGRHGRTRPADPPGPRGGPAAPRSPARSPAAGAG